MDHTIADRESFMALICEWHKDQERRDQVQHCQNVANLLDQALKLDLPPAVRRDMILAALGHDLYEDCPKLPHSEVLKFGERVDQLIQALTEGNDGVGPYVERMASAPEEARLIKLCDGADNYGSSKTGGAASFANRGLMPPSGHVTYSPRDPPVVANLALSAQFPTSLLAQIAASMCVRAFPNNAACSLQMAYPQRGLVAQVTPTTTR